MLLLLFCRNRELVLRWTMNSKCFTVHGTLHTIHTVLSHYMTFYLVQLWWLVDFSSFIFFVFFFFISLSVAQSQAISFHCSNLLYLRYLIDVVVVLVVLAVDFVLAVAFLLFVSIMSLCSVRARACVCVSGWVGGQYKVSLNQYYPSALSERRPSENNTPRIGSNNTQTNTPNADV